MEYTIVSKLVGCLLEQAEIDVDSDMWRWTDEDECCSPSAEVQEGLTDALLLFFEMFGELQQREIVHAIRKFTYRPTSVDLQVWRGF